MKEKRHKAPGKSDREGLSLVQLMDMFPDEAAATKWFEAQVWPTGRACGKCGSIDTYEIPSAKPMPYRCRDCQSYFSVRTGTVIERSKIPLRKWAIAIYLELTSLKSVSSMKLHRDLDLTQKNRMVHAAPYPAGLGGRDGQAVRRTRGSGRNVHGRAP